MVCSIPLLNSRERIREPDTDTSMPIIDDMIIAVIFTCYWSSPLAIYADAFMITLRLSERHATLAPYLPPLSRRCRRRLATRCLRAAMRVVCRHAMLSPIRLAPRYADTIYDTPPPPLQPILFSLPLYFGYRQRLDKIQDYHED